MPDAVALALVEALPAVAPTVGWQTIGALPSTRSAAAVSTDGVNIYATHGAIQGGTVVASGGAISQAGTVVALPGASVARQGVAGAWCNGKHYAIGGLNNNGQAVLAVEAYTPAGANGANGIWSTMANTPSGAPAYSSAAAIGNFIYVAGGQGASGGATIRVYRYDTVNNTWSTVADMPAARTQGAMVAVGTKLYYLGGLNTSNSAQSTVYVYDTSAGTWSTGTALNPAFYANGTAVAKTAAAAIGTTIYLAIGTSVSSYDITSGVQAAGTSTVTAGHGDFPGLVSIGQSLYYVSGSATTNVDKLDLGAGVGFTSAVLGAKSLLNPLLAGVAATLPTTAPADTTGRNAYAQTVQTLRALTYIT